MLTVRDLSLHLGGRTVLDRVDLSAAAGAITVVLGPNGAGKTSLIRCCTGLYPVPTGRVDVAGLTPRRAAETGLIGVMPQSGGSWSAIRAGELLTHLAAMHTAPLDVAALAARLRIADALRTPYRRLSGGQQQAVNLIAALVGRPRAVLLDEPTAGMDPRARLATWDLITDAASAGVAVVLSTHLMSEATRLGDRIAVLDGGRLRAAGTLRELTEPGEDLEAAFLRLTDDTGPAAATDTGSGAIR